MNLNIPKTQWAENIIVADGDYIDKVAFDLTVNFERMIGRRIPPADTARWAECVALDGGVRGEGNNVQVIFVHRTEKQAMENFSPGDYEGSLNGKAFTSVLGEFELCSVSPSDMTDKDTLFVETLKVVCVAEEVKRVMIVPDEEGTYNSVRKALNQLGDDKRITLFAMQPMAGGNYRQEILGYSLMSALGIRGDEIKEQ